MKRFVSEARERGGLMADPIEDIAQRTLAGTRSTKEPSRERDLLAASRVALSSARREQVQAQAELRDKDRAEVEKIGLAAMKTLAERIAAQAPKMTRQNLRVQIYEATKPVAELLKTTMAAAHLRGRLRVYQQAAPRLAAKNKALGAYDDALEYYRKRLKLTPEQIKRVVELYGNEAARVTRSVNDVLEAKATAALAQSLESNEHVMDAVERLRDAFDSAGVTPNNTFLLETLVRTQTQIAYGAGHHAAIQAPEIQEILDGFQYATIGDYRVRESHRSWDGFTAPKDHPFWATHWPPCGFNCRCTIVELFEPVESNIPDEYEPADEGFGIPFGQALNDGLDGIAPDDLRFALSSEDQPREDNGRWTMFHDRGALGFHARTADDIEKSPVPERRGGSHADASASRQFVE
jgi:SPP1 gp7 family putative phage head morphogenesis protein